MAMASTIYRRRNNRTYHLYEIQNKRKHAPENRELHVETIAQNAERNTRKQAYDNFHKNEFGNTLLYSNVCPH